ncbi:VOC family protein [Massilia suwonensis]|uniref:VOC family protein n=1 Tax=Massilia suwonensis TaxID=648895 RepID=A0ABW0MIM5_9BURK
MPRAVHFEIHATQPQALIDFYSSLFGWSFSKFHTGEYWMINTGPDSQPGINGGLLPRPGPIPGPTASPNAFVITIDVENLDASMAKAQGGGAVLCVPKMAIPKVGWLAYFKDPNGNIFGMMQMNSEAV